MTGTILMISLRFNFVWCTYFQGHFILYVSCQDNDGQRHDDETLVSSQKLSNQNLHDWSCSPNTFSFPLIREPIKEWIKLQQYTTRNFEMPTDFSIWDPTYPWKLPNIFNSLRKSCWVINEINNNNYSLQVLRWKFTPSPRVECCPIYWILSSKVNCQ